MKRSEINRALRELEAMCEKYRCYLPPFCRFTPDEWKTKGHEYDEVRECMLGWDITDYGLGNFNKVGFSLITIRNGSRKQPEKYPKVYAEKLLFLKEGQYSPNHFHWFKTEDIINRGGGNVLIRVYNSKEDESIDYESDVTVHTEGPIPSPPERRFASPRARAFSSISGCITILPSSPARVTCCSARSASATTTIWITASTRPWAAFLRLKRTSRRTGFCAASTRRQSNGKERKNYA